MKKKTKYTTKHDYANQGKRPDQVETTMKIIEWTVFVAVFAGFVALMWKIGTLTWNFVKLIF